MKRTHLHLISQNTLVNLRDAIVCDKEGQIPGDFSDSPDQSKNSKNGGEIFTSAMIFIEDTFYVDNRKLSSKDYSK